LYTNGMDYSLGISIAGVIVSALVAYLAASIRVTMFERKLRAPKAQPRPQAEAPKTEQHDMFV
jgi:hypothetical protein